MKSTARRNPRTAPIGKSLVVGVLLSMLVTSLPAPADSPAQDDPILGIYVHQHWAYNHPYAARTWSLDDWSGYLDGIKRLGYNTVLIWPVLETVPEPMTDSDRANLERIAKVIDMAHTQFAMRAYFVLCPNNRGKDEAAQYTFQDRPFFGTERRINPADAVEWGKLMAFRKELITPLKEADGIFIIDSDPGGWPYSTNVDFVSLLRSHRYIMDEVRPGMELIYWAAFGWEAYARFYETGEIRRGTEQEFDDTVHMIARNHLEPWWIASMNDPLLTSTLAMPERILSFNYGKIELEPSFPLTNFGDHTAYEGGQNKGCLGVLGNAQTHCVQLPNTFAFARGAQGLSCTRDDYVAFANDLLPGHGETIVAGWSSLHSGDVPAINSALAALERIDRAALKPGPLQGLLFGDPGRFVSDLVLQLRMMGTLEAFHRAAMARPHNSAAVKSSFAAFISAHEDWQRTHDYKNNWYLRQLWEALGAIPAPASQETLAKNVFVGEGETMFDQVQDGLRRMESFAPRLIQAMKNDCAALSGESR